LRGIWVLLLDFVSILDGCEGVVWGGELTVGNGAVVGFFVVAVLGEGVGDAGELGLDYAVFDGVVEGLRP
jgi:hypothetical protein